ncbi:DUF4179 domain-containing protein [Halobacillus sp. BAB-2008]|uniref:DUF4179 domain-containing protein n=1 Tax=Halobacillus sp. BAB-2008 TaxID=1246484 RepID=UPI0002A4EAF8|nr:DUF4179 domain-containing protein [Halobacillus sp. BAB-2008]ELK46096.1 hypothetical protein D479_12693 [Halobacillus sp. BAB-2008]
MKKDWFEERWNSIEVPEEELDKAITNGIQAGKKETPNKKHWKLPAMVSSAAASLILVSGLVFSPITEVLAKVPLLNFVYDEISFPVGSELFNKQLVTELNETATSNGVDVTITSAYYDNTLLGITFKVTSDQLSIEAMDRKNSPQAGYSYYLFNGDEQNQWGGSMSQLKETEEGFVGAMEFQQRDQSIGEDFTLPITFTSILGKKGTWKFDIPIEQRTPEKIIIDGHDTTTKGGYSFSLNSITKGEATTILNYTTTRPKNGEDDHFSIDVEDAQGDQLSKRNIGKTLSVNKTNESIKVKEQSLFSSTLNEKDDYILIHPKVSRDEFDTIQAFQKTPFEIQSDRFGYTIVVENVQMNHRLLTIDYYLKNVDREKLKKDNFLNFANQIKLIRSEDVIAGADGQAQYEALKEDSLIYGNNGEIINQGELHLQSTFEIKSNFNLKEYSLMVPFGIFSSNAPIELDPIKIDISF